MNITEYIGNDPQYKVAYLLLVTKQKWREEFSEKPRGKAAAVTHARYEGICQALDRLNMAHTTTEVEMAVLDAMNFAPKRPDFHFAGKNDEFNAWQFARVQDICLRLGWKTADQLLDDSAMVDGQPPMHEHKS